MLMKWLSIRSNPKQEIFELWNNDKKILTLNYHPETGSIRVSSTQEKRVLMIGKEGFRKNRTVLRNEYGIRIAKVLHESNQNNGGVIEYDDTRLSYSILKDITTHIRILNEMNDTIADCEVPALPDKSTISYDHLVLGLCWYSYISSAKEQELEYA